MLCTILKTFPISRDGIRAETASAGSEVDIPDALVAGLKAEGYVRTVEAKAMRGAPERQAIEAAQENKEDRAELREEYERVIGKRPFMGWDAAMLREKIAEAEG